MAALDAAPVALFVVNSQARILFANGCAVHVFGRARSDFDGIDFEALLEPESRPRFRGDLVECLATSGVAPPKRRDIFGLDRAGQPFPIELSLGRSSGEGVSTAVIVVRDASDQRRQEKEQLAAASESRAAREWLEALLEFAPAFIIGVNEQGIIEFINRTLPQHSKRDVIGSSWLPYFPPQDQAQMTAALKATFATGATQTYQISTPGPDGEDIWFESQIAPVRVHERVVGAVLVAQDVTERKRSQAELVAGRHMATLGTLAAGVAHEINTPIQFVGDSVQYLRDAASELLGLIEKLQELRKSALAGSPLEEVMAAAHEAEEEADLSYMRENMPQAFERCIDGLNRVTTIVRSLKDFAHPSGTEMMPADLNRAVEGTLTIAANEYKYVATVKTDLGLLPPVVCHVGEISQAVLNIVVNAAHAIADVVKDSGEKGVISVRTRVEGDDVVIAISDTGTGIPESARPRIFDPFFTTKAVGKGTGQGLAIAHSSVNDRHGGKLTFETELGKGTTFFIRLPINGAAKPA
jgi:PAS domain S-box-containing protein